jgi:hypothetical protein
MPLFLHSGVQTGVFSHAAPSKPVNAQLHVGFTATPILIAINIIYHCDARRNEIKYQSRKRLRFDKVVNI